MLVLPLEGSVRTREPLLSLSHWELGGLPAGLSPAEAVALSRAQVLPAQVSALEKRPGPGRLCCDPGAPLALPQAALCLEPSSLPPLALGKLVWGVPEGGVNRTPAPVP